MAASRRDFLWSAALAGAAVAASGCGLADADEPDAATRQKIDAILLDKEIWGPEFGQVLVSLPTWSAAGIDSVQVFPEQVVGGAAQKTADAAQAVQNRVAAVDLPKKYTLRPALAQAYPVAGPALRAEVLKSFADDQSARLTWRGTERFLAKDLTIADVRKKHGKAEKVRTVAISSERDTRPLVLTFHEYAKGAVAFIESDAVPTPRLVNRVALAVGPTVAAAFTTEPKE